MPTLASAASKKDFRNVNWGMSYTQVKKLEKSKLANSGKAKGYSFLMYHSTVSRMPAVLTYVFYKDKLVRAVYHVKHKSTDKVIDKMSDYYSIKRDLLDEYDSSVNGAEIFGHDGSVSNSYSGDDVKALANAEIYYKTWWVVNKKKTRIELILDSEEGPTRLRVLYTDTKSNIDKQLEIDGA